MTEQPSTDPLPLLSDHLGRHVAAIGAGVVAVHGRHGPPFSGFVWRRGAIVTAEEALEADEDITITVPDGRRIGATLAGRDPTTDVAVLRITDSEDLAPLAASTRSDLGAGHLALAVGRRPEGVIAHVGAVSVAGGPWHSMRGGQRGGYGKPHQGDAGRSVRGPDLGRHHAGEPAQAVVRLDGLRAHVRAAPHRAPAHPVR